MKTRIRELKDGALEISAAVAGRVGRLVQGRPALLRDEHCVAE